MFKLLLTTIALTAIGVGVKARSETYIKSRYNPILSGAEITETGVRIKTPILELNGITVIK